MIAPKQEDESNDTIEIELQGTYRANGDPEIHLVVCRSCPNVRPALGNTTKVLNRLASIPRHNERRPRAIDTGDAE
jgi:hypothetical protein